MDTLITQNILQYVNNLNARVVCKQWHDLYILSGEHKTQIFAGWLWHPNFSNAKKYITFISKRSIEHCFLEASGYGRIDTIKWLDRNTCGPDDVIISTSIEIAGDAMQYETVKFLIDGPYTEYFIKKGYCDECIADAIDAIENECLHRACLNGNYGLAELFICKQNTYFTNSAGLNVLAHACKSGRFDFMQLIISHQKDFLEQNRSYFIDIIEWGIIYEQFEICEFALKSMDFYFTQREFIRLSSIANIFNIFDSIPMLEKYVPIDE